MARRVLSLVCLLLVVGCRHNASQSVSVSGTITVSGQPLSGAIITWEPTGATGGPKATTSIFDGNYKVEESANLQPGTYLVRISMLPPEILKKIEPTDGITLPSPSSVIAREFDTDSKLSFELKTGQENKFNCDVRFR